MISVITTTHNNIKTIDQLYKSLTKQTYKNFEWIVSDDGSDDGTWQKLQYFDVKNQINMDAVAQLNRGMRLPKTINQALKRSTGNLIFVVFGDSYLDDNVLETLHDTYEPNTAGCGLRINMTESKNFHSWDWRIGDDLRLTNLTIDLTHWEEPYMKLCGNGMIVERKALEKIGWWPEEYEGYGREDWCTYLRLHRSGIKLMMYNNIPVRHFWHGESGADNPKNIELFNKEVNESITRF